MTVGSKCIHNYAKVHEKLFGRSADIRYPSKYKKAARFLNEKFPGTVTVDHDRTQLAEPDWDETDFQHFTEETVDDLTPEGMGFDEIDWDSFDWEQD